MNSLAFNDNLECLREPDEKKEKVYGT